MKKDGFSSSNRRVFIKAYGCQMNVYDGTRMMDVLAQEGYTACDTPDEADLVILNTCHIREKAAEKVYSELGRMRQIRTQRPHQPLRLGVAGCVAQAEGEEMLRRAPFVDMVFGPQTYHMLPRMLHQLDKGAGPVMMLDFPEKPNEKFDMLPEETADKGPVSFLTVQEGCDKFCTYCVVPYTRGIEISRPVADVLAEAARLVRGGAKELVLLGQNVSAYHGLNEEGIETGLGDVLRLLAEKLEPLGLRRLRYTTSHPRDTQDDLIAAHRDVPLVMPFLHLPVQSGSDKVLKEMNRKHPRARYLETIARFREVQPDIALSSDFIVGFPGETDEDFQQTMDLVRQVGFAQAYSFKYSPRPGTPGANRTDQVPEKIKKERLAALQGLLWAQQLAYNQSFVGRTVQVLMEKKGNKEGQWIGRTPYMQSVYVTLPQGASLHVGDFCNLHIKAGYQNSLEGMWCEQSSLAKSGQAA